MCVCGVCVRGAWCGRCVHVYVGGVCVWGGGEGCVCACAITLAQKKLVPISPKGLVSDGECHFSSQPRLLTWHNQERAHPPFTGVFPLGDGNIDTCNGHVCASVYLLGFCRNSGHLQEQETLH